MWQHAHTPNNSEKKKLQKNMLNIFSLDISKKIHTAFVYIHKGKTTKISLHVCKRYHINHHKYTPQWHIVKMILIIKMLHLFSFFSYTNVVVVFTNVYCVLLNVCVCVYAPVHTVCGEVGVKVDVFFNSQCTV